MMNQFSTSVHPYLKKHHEQILGNCQINLLFLLLDSYQEMNKTELQKGILFCKDVYKANIELREYLKSNSSLFDTYPIIKPQFISGNLAALIEMESLLHIKAPKLKKPKPDFRLFKGNRTKSPVKDLCNFQYSVTLEPERDLSFDTLIPHSPAYDDNLLKGKVSNKLLTAFTSGGSKDEIEEAIEMGGNIKTDKHFLNLNNFIHESSEKSRGKIMHMNSMASMNSVNSVNIHLSSTAVANLPGIKNKKSENKKYRKPSNGKKKTKEENINDWENVNLRDETGNGIGIGIGKDEFLIANNHRRNISENQFKIELNSKPKYTPEKNNSKDSMSGFDSAGYGSEFELCKASKGRKEDVKLGVVFYQDSPASTDSNFYSPDTKRNLISLSKEEIKHHDHSHSKSIHSKMENKRESNINSFFKNQENEELRDQPLNHQLDYYRDYEWEVDLNKPKKEVDRNSFYF